VSWGGGGVVGPMGEGGREHVSEGEGGARDVACGVGW